MISFRKRTRPVFVLGCQRSGTTICQNVFLRSPHCDVFREGNKRAMTDEWRLRNEAAIRELIRKSRKAVALFKPLNDAQWAPRFLADYDDARIVWIYRDPGDTSNSAVTKWGDVQGDIIRTVGRALEQGGNAAGAVDLLSGQPGFAMYAEQIPDAAAARIVAWAGAGLDPHSGAAALWWLRNQFFTALGLDRDERALLVKYESFVQDPGATVRRICGHMGVPFSESLVAEVHAGSVGRRPQPDLEPSVAAACRELMAVLDGHWAATESRDRANSAAG
jgi:hypothetical protein